MFSNLFLTRSSVTAKNCLAYSITNIAEAIRLHNLSIDSRNDLLIDEMHDSLIYQLLTDYMNTYVPWKLSLEMQQLLKTVVAFSSPYSKHCKNKIQNPKSKMRLNMKKDKKLAWLKNFVAKKLPHSSFTFPP